MSDYKLFRCIQCGFEYDEAVGWPEDGIASSTESRSRTRDASA